MFDFYSQKIFSSPQRRKGAGINGTLMTRIVMINAPSRAKNRGDFRNATITDKKNILKSYFIRPISVIRVPLLYLLPFIFYLLPFTLRSQSVGIFGSTNLGVNTTGAKGNLSSIFDISSTTKGLLIPRMTTAQIAAMNPLPAAAQGLLVYQTDGTEGFYYNTSITTTPNWVLVAAGGTNAPWTRSGTNVFLTNNSSGDSVGIGTSAPTAKLHIVKTGGSDAAIYAANSGSGYSVFGYNNGTGLAGYFWLNNTASTATALVVSANGQNSRGIFVQQGGTAGIGINHGLYSLVDGVRGAGSTNIAGYFSASGATNNYAAIFDAGNVGIGTTSPTARLDVQSSGALSAISAYTTGTMNAGYFQINNASNSATALYATTNGTGIALNVSNTNTAAGTKYSIYSSASSAAGTTGIGGYFTSTGAGTNYAAIFDNGNVGIGTSAPSEKLHVEQTGDINKHVIFSRASQTSTSTDYQNIGVAGWATSNAIGFGFGAGVVGLGTPYTITPTVGLYSSIGVYAGLSATMPTVGIANNHYALFADAGTIGGITKFAGVFMNGNVGIGTTAPASMLSVGAGNQFQVNSSGNIVKLNNVITSFPAANASGVLTNDGTGTLTWTAAAAAGWSLLGNSGTVDGNNFIGTTDDIPFNIRVNNQKAGRISSGDNIFLGFFAGANSNVAVIDNIAIGDSALYTQSFATPFSSHNVAIGNSALYANQPNSTSTGNNNVAIGTQAMRNNTIGNNNMVAGYQALYSNTNGASHTAIGYHALFSNTNGGVNTALGNDAMYSNLTGSYNTVAGSSALYSNTTGSRNSAYGYESLRNNIGASYNSSFGDNSLRNNTYAQQNVAVGNDALYTQNYPNSTTVWATDNTAVGYQALYTNNPTNSSNGYLNTAIGSVALRANTTGAANVATGAGALYQNTTGGANIATGTSAMYTNSTGSSNVAAGHWALYQNSSGSYNNAIGREALFNNTASSNNAFGFRAMYSNTNSSDNVAIGDSALYSQSFVTAFSSENVAIGNSALFSNNPSSTINGFRNTAIGTWALRNNTIGSRNTANGFQALYSNTTGGNNTAIGMNALYTNNNGVENSAFGYHPLYLNTGGSYNAAMGNYALYSNTIGNYNTANGSYALYSNVAGSNATALGYKAMYYANNAVGAFDNFSVAVGYEALRGSTTAANNTGNYNTALGYQTLFSNTNSSYNTAIGHWALNRNTATSGNIAIGDSALYFQSFGTAFSSQNVAIGNSALFVNNPTATSFSGNQNTAVGNQALRNNTTGYANTATGYQALYSTTNGSNNTADGWQALFSFSSGQNNTANGYQALYTSGSISQNTATGASSLYFNTTGNYNTAHGYAALLANGTGSNNTAIGNSADVSSGAFTNATAIGNGATVNASNKIVIGNTSSTTVGGYGGWTNYSDGRFKTNVKEDVPGLDFITKLRPVTYTLMARDIEHFFGRPDSLINQIRESYDRAEKIVRTGFIAQEVEKIATQLNYDFDGVYKPQNEKDNYALSYGSFVVPLVKAVQELDKKNEELEATIKSQQSEISNLQAAIKKLEISNQQQVTSNQQLLKEVEKIKEYLELKSKK